MVAFEELPEGCIAAILSCTTPADAGRFSVVSKTFRCAADSDAVWNHFLRYDSQFIDFIISHSPPSIANTPTKKALFLTLSDRPIIIDNAQKSLQLDRKSGKKCYMLAARSLAIAWGDDDRYCNWIAVPDSRFPKVAKLLHVRWLEIHGKINTNALSPNTQYAAYLVFKMIAAFGFENHPLDLLVRVEGSHRSTKIVCLDTTLVRRNKELICLRLSGASMSHNKVVGLRRPSVRRDGWLEIEMGEFFNLCLGGVEVHINVIEIDGDLPKGNFFLEGIEVRPKEDN